jgi:type I restriction enzyme S subunit
MQQLLTGQTRLPGFSGEWELSTIGEKTDKVGSGITPTGGARGYRSSGRPFVRSQNVGWGKLLMDDVAFIDDATHETFAATEIQEGDVFLNITGASIGRSAMADLRVVGGNVNQHVCIIRPHPPQLDAAFLQHVLLSDAGQAQIDSFQAGGNRQGLNFSQIRSMNVLVPPVDEQAAIAAALSDMDAEITALEARRDKTRLLKQGMMQELLTGRTRLV